MSPHKPLILLPLITQVFGSCLASLPAARLMEKMGRKLGFQVAGLIGIFGSMLCIIAIKIDSFALLTFSTFVLGMFNAFGEFSKYGAAEQFTDRKKRSRAISIVVFSGIFSAFIGPTLANISSQYFSDTSIYLGPYISTLILCLIFFTVSLLIKAPIENTETVIKCTSKVPVRELLQNTSFIAAAVVGAMAYLVMASIMDVTPVTMLDHGFHFSHTASVMQWHLVAMFGTSYFTGKLISRKGIKFTIYLGICINIVGMSISLSGSEYFNFWLCLFFVGMGWNMMYIAASNVIANLPKRIRSIGEGTSNIVISSSFAISTPIAAIIYQYLGWQYVIYFSLLYLVLSFSFTFKIGLSSKMEASEPTI